MSAVGDGEAVVFRQVGQYRRSPYIFERGSVLFVVDIREALQEHQREDELLVVAGVDEAAEERQRRPTGTPRARAG